MTGLELITDKILADAKAEAEEKAAAARERIGEIEAEYAAERERVRGEYEEKKKAMKKHAQEALESALRAKEREALLEVQNETAHELIAEAKSRILSLDTTGYFEFLTELYKNTADDKQGELLLTAADRERMPEWFIENLNKLRGSVTLSKEDAPGAGFIIRYGLVEINCTIDAIFEDKINQLSDIAAAHCKE